MHKKISVVRKKKCLKVIHLNFMMDFDDFACRYHILSEH